MVYNAIGNHSKLMKICISEFLDKFQVCNTKVVLTFKFAFNFNMETISTSHPDSLELADDILFSPSCLIKFTVIPSGITVAFLFTPNNALKRCKFRNLQDRQLSMRLGEFCFDLHTPLLTQNVIKTFRLTEMRDFIPSRRNKFTAISCR